MEKKQYIIPDVEIVSCRVRNILKVGSELPDDPGTVNSAPRHRKDVF